MPTVSATAGVMPLKVMPSGRRGSGLQKRITLRSIHFPKATDPNGTKLSRIFDADGICDSWGHAFESDAFGKKRVRPSEAYYAPLHTLPKGD